MTDNSQHILEQAQVFQQQIQGIITQKETMNLQLLEIKKALEELEKSKETEVFKLSGPVLIKTKKADIEKEMKEQEEIISVKVKTLETSEKRIKDKLEELRKKLAEEHKPSKKTAG